MVGTHGLAHPASTNGDGRVEEGSPPARSWANVVGSPGRGEGAPGGGREVRQDPGPAAECWPCLGDEGVQEGQGNSSNRSWAGVVASPAPGEGGMVAQGTTVTREQVTHHITPLLYSSTPFLDNNLVFITNGDSAF